MPQAGSRQIWAKGILPVVLRLRKMSVLFIFVYCQHGVGPQGNDQLLRRTGELIKATCMPWAVIGDFNFPAEELQGAK